MNDTAQEPRPRRLLDQVRDKLRTLHYSPRTEDAYIGWIKRYIYFHGKRHPKDLGEGEVEAFLTALATERGVSASTQNQALCALLFRNRSAPPPQPSPTRGEGAKNQRVTFSEPPVIQGGG